MPHVVTAPSVPTQGSELLSYLVFAGPLKSVRNLSQQGCEEGNQHVSVCWHSKGIWRISGEKNLSDALVADVMNTRALYTSWEWLSLYPSWKMLGWQRLPHRFPCTHSAQLLFPWVTPSMHYCPFCHHYLRPPRMLPTSCVLPILCCTTRCLPCLAQPCLLRLHSCHMKIAWIISWVPKWGKEKSVFFRFFLTIFLV
jgi:hypothetical protein